METKKSEPTEDADTKDDGGTSVAQTSGGKKPKNGDGSKCYVCGRTEHVTPECAQRFDKAGDWFMPNKHWNYSASQVATQESATPEPQGTHLVQIRTI